MMPRSPMLTVLLGLLLAAAGRAQRGDRAGQEQPPIPDSVKIPPAPVLSPAEGLRSLRVAKGFVVELVAAEPLVEDPVCISFDADGRLWAVEMRGFMPNVDGTGELEPNGRVVVLTDTDGDGQMDERQVFLDHLVLPRLVSHVQGGVLVLAPPKLYLCRDRDGDGRCDEKVLLRDGLPGQKGPEHAINGGMLGLDNWIEFAKFGERLGWVDGAWRWRPQLFRGQWGITRDDQGRQFHNGNSDHLRGDLFPAHYAVRNPAFGRSPGANIQIVRDQSTWPIRITPGINRGYVEGMLRDYKLARFTAACSPVIYRDRVFPEACRGDAFVCEPAGNFVRRARLESGPLRVVGANAYQEAEFLASTDERFRPVDLKIGPDGGLYVVDMYRGILQHKVYVTSFLRKQILARHLDRPLGLGRIYRVWPEGAERRPPPRLSNATDAALVAALGHDSGWWRDTAQRLLVGRGRELQAGTAEPVPAFPILVQKIATATRAPASALTRLHALWTLAGFGVAWPAVTALEDEDPWVRRAAIRVLEPRLTGNPAVRSQVVARLDDPDPGVVLQAVHSLGADRNGDLGPLVTVAVRPGMTRILAGAIGSGLAEREVVFLRALLAGEGFAESSSGRPAFLADLARAVARRRQAEPIPALLAIAVADTTASWQAAALLRGVGDVLGRRAKTEGTDRVLVLPARPESLERRDGTDPLAAKVLVHLAWPGRPLRSRVKTARTPAEKKRLAAGKVQYTLRCFACHGITGKGQPGVAPSLVGSRRVLGKPEQVIPMLIHGLKGPLVVDGKEWNLLMPPVPEITDAEVAAVLSYVRTSFGHRESLVTPAEVRAVRKKFAGRTEPFTVEELDRLR